MMRYAGATVSALLVVFVWCHTFSGARGAEKNSVIEEVQADFRRELFERGLKGVVSVLEDNGISSLSIFAKLEEEDFSALSLKLGHRREMLHWWRSLNQAGFRRAERRKSNVENEMKHVTIRSHDNYPSPAATHADWGAEIFNKCIQPYSWSKLRSGYKSMNSSMSFKTGGLGKLLEQDGYETWLCLSDHYCAIEGMAENPTNSWFCFVFHETTQTFTPWGENSRLKLVPLPIGRQETNLNDCKICKECFDFEDYEEGKIVEASGTTIGRENFTFTTWMTPSEINMGIILSRDRAGNGVSQFRIQTFLDNRIGIMLYDFGVYPGTGTTRDTNGWGSACVTKSPLVVHHEQHFAVVRSGSTWSMFLNGKLETECLNSAGVTDVFQDPTRPLRLGSFSPFVGNGTAAIFKGSMRAASLNIGLIMTGGQIAALLLSNISACKLP